MTTPRGSLATKGHTVQVTETREHLELRFPTPQVRDLVIPWFSADHPNNERRIALGWGPLAPIGFCRPKDGIDGLVWTLPLGFKQRLEEDAQRAGVGLAGITHPKSMGPSLKVEDRLINFDRSHRDLITLDPLQVQACHTLLSNPRCALELSTGSGKTEVALNAWALLREGGLVRRALFVVPSKTLRSQAFSRTLMRSPYAEAIGVIGGGKFDAKNKRMVVGTVQSACGDERLRHCWQIVNYLQEVDLLIIDEAHHATSKQYQRLLQLCKASWVWGLSGKFTYQAARHAAKAMALEGIFGKPKSHGSSPERTCPTSVVFHVNQAWRGQAEDLNGPSGKTDMAPCLFQRQPGGLWEDGFWRGLDRDGNVPGLCAMPDPKDIVYTNPDGSTEFARSAMVRDIDSPLPGALKYNPSRMVLDPSKSGPYVRKGSVWEQVINPAGVLCPDQHFIFQAGFTPRNQWALDLAKFFAERGEPFLVTVRRVVHARLLYSLFRAAGLNVPSYHGKLDDGERTKRLAALREGSIQGLIATYSTVSEGTDLPSLVHLIKLDGVADEQVLTQQIGRVQRRSPGKKKGLIHIPVDVQLATFEPDADRMKKYYASQGFTIRDVKV